MTDIKTTNEDALGLSGLVRLAAWLSPAFPVGAYTYSHGLEWAIEAGDVTDAASLEAWIAAILKHGAGRSDVILFANAWTAAAHADFDRLEEIAGLGLALCPTKERRLEATAQGRAFAGTVAKTWGAPSLEALGQSGEAIVYPVAVAVAAADHGVPLVPAATAMLSAFAANLVSAAVRAVPLGQTDGQRVTARMEPVIHEVVTEAALLPLEEIGGASLAADIASMHHETQYTRLFRS
ncbi:Urease accessory protein UreF [Hartmannibacter diazotrophicus]|uniref:Urease accessory protein UreF n=1 Tax=Hartmannibacter diazotrophicus TaxID=1482074 RepID=A0A2C9DCN2_9HYPH|nr:urease accessory protein UreF [Hartmannibacter diazotrophicus]SON57888.1 Urease accessory protein UreF [Hartmannibacter diazotrophicus]